MNEPTMNANWKQVPQSAKAGLVCGALAFVVRITSTSTTTANGLTVSCSYTDYGALILGGIAIVFGGAGLVQAMRSNDGGHAPAVLGLCSFAVLLGVAGVLRGIGAVGGQC